MSFGKIDDVKKNWECATDQATRREMMREIKKEELQNLRSRLFQVSENLNLHNFGSGRLMFMWTTGHSIKIYNLLDCSE